MDDKTVTELKQGAIAMHEVFITFKDTGFTSDEALYLVGEMLKAVISK